MNTYQKIIKRLQKEQDDTYNTLPKKYHKLVARAIDIEYVLTMAELEHTCHLESEATARELKALQKEDF